MLSFGAALLLQLALTLPGDQWPDTHGIIRADWRVKIPNLPDDAVAFNPSIAQVENHVVLAFRCDRNDMGWGPHMNIGVAVLDANLNVKGTPTLFPFPTNDMGMAMSTAEDPRLVAVGSRLFVTYNSMVDNPWGGRRGLNIAELTLEDADSDEPKISSPHRSRLVFLADGQLRMTEKNWAPFAYDDAVYFVYQTNPPWVAKIDPNRLNTALEGSWPEEIALEEVSRRHDGRSYGFGEMRGGTQALRDEVFGGDYLAFFHGRDYANYGSGHRMHLTIGFYTFAPEPPFEITRLLPFPISVPDINARGRPDLECAYPGGVVWHDGRLLIAYGHMDDSVHILEVDPDELLTHSESFVQDSNRL